MKLVWFCMSNLLNNQAAPGELPNTYTPRDTMALHVTKNMTENSENFVMDCKTFCPKFKSVTEVKNQ